ncbi:GlsB/YeaQ/YmgE family stress response membrane protein [Micromonospora orduensis]|uniref:GlsB/YeaQ/YmgE family stress response membrane protein n=1 Tax=Micromonospora orduensis TaxID=1420891 RepID=UPI00363BADAD
MTVGALLSALAVGLAVGALGRLVIPGRQPVPRWVTAAVGVVAALLGSLTVRLAGDAGRLSFGEALVQVCAAGVAVVLVVVTSGRHRSTTPPARTRR